MQGMPVAFTCDTKEQLARSLVLEFSEDDAETLISGGGVFVILAPCLN
jgi:hypothetical protein